MENHKENKISDILLYRNVDGSGVGKRFLADGTVVGYPKSTEWSVKHVTEPVTLRELYWACIKGKYYLINGTLTQAGLDVPIVDGHRKLNRRQREDENRSPAHLIEQEDRRLITIDIDSGSVPEGMTVGNRESAAWIIGNVLPKHLRDKELILIWSASCGVKSKTRIKCHISFISNIGMPAMYQRQWFRNIGTDASVAGVAQPCYFHVTFEDGVVDPIESRVEYFSGKMVDMKPVVLDLCERARQAHITAENLREKMMNSGGVVHDNIRVKERFITLILEELPVSFLTRTGVHSEGTYTDLRDLCWSLKEELGDRWIGIIDKFKIWTGNGIRSTMERGSRCENPVRMGTLIKIAEQYNPTLNSIVMRELKNQAKRQIALQDLVLGKETV